MIRFIDIKIDRKNGRIQSKYHDFVWLSEVLSACDTDHANVFDVKGKYSHPKHTTQTDCDDI